MTDDIETKNKKVCFFYIQNETLSITNSYIVYVLHAVIEKKSFHHKILLKPLGVVFC